MKRSVTSILSVASIGLLLAGCSSTTPDDIEITSGANSDNVAKIKKDTSLGTDPYYIDVKGRVPKDVKYLVDFEDTDTAQSVYPIKNGTFEIKTNVSKDPSEIKLYGFDQHVSEGDDSVQPDEATHSITIKLNEK